MSETNAVGQVMELPAEERLNLARRLLESVVTPDASAEAVALGVERIEEVLTGRKPGLTEEEYRAELE